MRLLKKSFSIIILFTLMIFLNSQSVYADIRSEGGVLNEKGIQWCAEEQPRYEIMGLELYLKNNHYSLEARVCANLLEDELWNYQGADRVEKLIERSKFYALAEIEESELEAETLKDDPTPTDVDPTILALEQWRSGEISEEELDEKLSSLGWQPDKIEDFKETQPITQEDVMELDNEVLEIEEVKEEKEDEIVETPSDGGGCLIATATFGTELAPQVQLLREIREDIVLNTNSGSTFMIGFNQFYYSFSPIIADWERENPTFKEIVRVMITPLLASLNILDYYEINSELEMIGIGTGIISLNVAMYFVGPALLVLKRRQIRKLFF